MKDALLLNARKKLEESPGMTDKEFRVKETPFNDEEDINNLKFDEKDKKDYDILEHIEFG